MRVQHGGLRPQKKNFSASLLEYEMYHLTLRRIPNQYEVLENIKHRPRLYPLTLLVRGDKAAVKCRSIEYENIPSYIQCVFVYSVCSWAEILIGFD